MRTRALSRGCGRPRRRLRRERPRWTNRVRWSWPCRPCCCTPPPCLRCWPSFARGAAAVTRTGTHSCRASCSAAPLPAARHYSTCSTSMRSAAGCCGSRRTHCSCCVLPRASRPSWQAARRRLPPRRPRCVRAAATATAASRLRRQMWRRRRWLHTGCAPKTGRVCGGMHSLRRAKTSSATCDCTIFRTLWLNCRVTSSTPRWPMAAPRVWRTRLLTCRSS
mmetsp:Transcript_41645/g.124482  ORF Transcript_41645/g.124482 Transcript_41645/m.124482 type:complete len:221 (+) Transcript_41645:762-1424(+)